MVYVDSRNLGWRPYLWRWLNARPVWQADLLRPLLEKYAAPAVDWVTEGLDGGDLVKKPAQGVPRTALNLVAQLCGLLEVVIAEAGGSGGDGGGEEDAGGGQGAPGAGSSRLQDGQVG